MLKSLVVLVLLIPVAILLGFFGTILGLGIALLALVLKVVFFIVLPVWLCWMLFKWITRTA